MPGLPLPLIESSSVRLSSSSYAANTVTPKDGAQKLGRKTWGASVAI